ncbi:MULTISPECIES: hypothetical protein [Rhizobium]|uniref:hypothetical protein n=1 Tax=Rhizobium TaxID=379 RepID=UPI00235DC776|nr:MULTISPECIES: hypothetical protein [unclassified Rhizobium]MDC9810163.1 hypothetical protein [Rhizobium sp. MC62]WEA24279.1 hypothetical protein PO862_14345 [Rhizobium sp. MJ22]WEA58795.1 hypothetical protein PO860_13900 [Rhizobium sp. BJ04]
MTDAGERALEIGVLDSIIWLDRCGRGTPVKLQANNCINQRGEATASQIPQT